jgi:hypothetical protein
VIVSLTIRRWYSIQEQQFSLFFLITAAILGACVVFCLVACCSQCAPQQVFSGAVGRFVPRNVYAWQRRDLPQVEQPLVRARDMSHDL